MQVSPPTTSLHASYAPGDCIPRFSGVRPTFLAPGAPFFRFHTPPIMQDIASKAKSYPRFAVFAESLILLLPRETPRTVLSDTLAGRSQRPWRSKQNECASGSPKPARLPTTRANGDRHAAGLGLVIETRHPASSGDRGGRVSHGDLVFLVA